MIIVLRWLAVVKWKPVPDRQREGPGDGPTDESFRGYAIVRPGAYSTSARRQERSFALRRRISFRGFSAL
jgi:hypothetical protein